MSSPEEEIQSAMLTGNFHRSCQMAEEWLKLLPAGSAATPEKNLAREAYQISRFFLHRMERISHLQPGREKAQLFRSFLPEMEKLREENGESVPESPFYRAVMLHIHGSIADGLAREFAGQKSHSLESPEMIQLAVSLIHTRRYGPALETLDFILRYFPRLPEAHFLSAVAAWHENREADVLLHMREAMFLKPEVVGEYPEFLPGGVFADLWDHLSGNDLPEKARYRYYALTLEINGVYRKKKRLKEQEFRKIEEEYRRLLSEYEKAGVLKDEVEPRLLHYLCWMIFYAQQEKDYERLEDFRAKMIEIAPNIWQIFQQKALA